MNKDAIIQNARTSDTFKKWLTYSELCTHLQIPKLRGGYQQRQLDKLMDIFYIETDTFRSGTREIIKYKVLFVI